MWEVTIQYKRAVGDSIPLKCIATAGRISQFAGYALTGIDLYDYIFSKDYKGRRDYIYDQLVDKIVGYHLSSATHEAIEIKYSYARYRIEQLIDEGQLTYRVGFFGIGDVTDYNLSPEIKSQLIFELAVLSAFMVDEGLESMYMFDVAFPTSTLGLGSKPLIWDLVEKSKINTEEID